MQEIVSSQWSTMKEIIESRGSVKSYDTHYEIPEQDLNEILVAAIQAPSAWNLQHWRFMIFQGKAEQEELAKVAYYQPQIMGSSVVVAVLGDLRADLVAEEIYKPQVEKGQMKEEVYQQLLQNINAYYQTERVARDEAILNASLAAMQLMLAVKAKGLDSCPIGGFDRQAFMEKYQVDKRYVPLMLISIGKAAQPARPTSRISLEKVILPKGK